MKIPEKTIDDLEFTTVLQQLSGLAITDVGKDLSLQLKPIENEEELLLQLHSVSEFVASFENENRIPNHGFDDITEEIDLLKIENIALEVTSFRRISVTSETINTLLLFFKKFKEYYPNLFLQGSDIEITKILVKEINSIIDKFGEIRNDASPTLYQIRKNIQIVRAKVGQSFQRSLNHYNTSDYLDDICESVVENCRVLAVKAMYRRKVKGTIMGSSRTGSIVYIEPEATLQYTRELNNLKFEETDEIKRILLQLTKSIQPYRPLLMEYQIYLTMMDSYYARAKYAESMNGILPKINSNRELYLIKAYHPLLYLSNKKERKQTFPQDITLHPEHRIVVISGPNAGGKSITLKTIGLLQLMLQSGMLIPVNEGSSVCFFKQIITDIGDNQSIENHLSTYSYRLKNMRYFIRKCNEDTLFLIDEFGTGSDPELGGALAEVFLEEFYNKAAYGIITTHYSNLKMLASELPFMFNANMQFDNRTLEPTFNLIMGEAGSSSTFEVAQKNGIPFSLINKAKKKIERSKIRFEATIVKLQKERSIVTQTSKSLQERESKAIDQNERLELLNKKVKDKLVGYQELFDHDQRMVVLGNKTNDIAERYFDTDRKRVLVAELLRLVESENSKRKKKPIAEKKKEKEVKKKVNEEVKKAIVDIREEKKKEKRKPIVGKVKLKVDFKIGDEVRLLDGKSVGTIDSIEKEKAIVNYGMFTTQVRLEELDLVKAKKKKK